MREKLLKTWQVVGARRAGALNYVLTGFVLLWLVYDRAGHLMRSALQETGLIVLFVVAATAFLVESLGFRYIRVSHVVRALGFKAPSEPGLRAALLIGVTMLLFFPALSLATGVRFGLQENWPWIALGVLAQAGLAHELIFRGYLFRHLRRDFSFMRAALFVMALSVAGGLLLFGSTNPLAVIARLVVLAASALPLAHLYEHSGQSIWPPALISAVSQAALQVVILPAHLSLVALVGWTIISAAVPQLAFVLLARHEEPARPHTEPVRPRYDH
jgi:membrane protease YdiL (CAAX protease family)